MSEEVENNDLASRIKNNNGRIPNCGGYNANTTPRESILREAERIVEGDRQLEYGDKTECFTRIGNMWSAYLGVPVSPFDVAHMMIMLKLARNVHKYKRDSMVDVAGYALCADKMHDDILAKQSKFNGEY